MAPLLRRGVVSLVALVTGLVSSQVWGQYDQRYGYQQDYVDLNEGGRGGGLVRAGLGGGAVGFFVGQVWYRFLKQRMMKKSHDKKKKKLKKDFGTDYDKIKDIAMLRLRELEYSCDAVDRVIEQLENTLHSPFTDESKRKKAEFKLPDANDDNLISRAEFNNYLKSYFAAHPELAEMDYPTFDDFDQDQDGLVTFPEWKNFITQLEAAAEEEEKKKYKKTAY